MTNLRTRKPNPRQLQARAEKAESDARAWYGMYTAFVQLTAQYHFQPELPPFLAAHLERRADIHKLFERWSHAP